MKPDFLTIAVDFDGTIIGPHQYPEAKTANPFAIECLKVLSRCPRVKLILWSCRDKDSDLTAYNNMINWLDEHNIHFDAINDNLEEHKKHGFKCRKVFANIYIDDLSNESFGSKNKIIDYWCQLWNRIYNDRSLNQWVDEMIRLI